MKLILLATLAAVVVALAWLATRPSVPKPYAAAYSEALQRFPGSDAAIELGIERFQRAYSDLTDPSIEQRIRDLYAESLYFHDTLKQLDNRQDLVDYMSSMGHSIDSSRVTIAAVLQQDADVYLRWTMSFQTQAAGKPMHSESIGMTHLRFDQDGRVVLHQDFWDPASGLYRHMPLVGWLLDRVDHRLDSP